MATKHEDRYEITRITLTIAKPFTDVLSRLKTSLVRSGTGSGLQILDHLSSRADFEHAVTAQLGPHGFMQFMQLHHGAWMGLYNTHVGKQATRIVFGNPLIAITMLEHDVNAGLFAPVEALLVEREDGNTTDVVYVKPSTLIAGRIGSSEQLKKAAEALDMKLEALWEWVAAKQDIE